jgi:hypothetical protein
VTSSAAFRNDEPLFDGKAARDFFIALQVDPATVHYRGIHWDKTLPIKDRARHIAPSTQPQQQRLEELQRGGYRLYWLPNGGPTDEHVTTCRFLFVEWDDHPLEWQLQAWRTLSLPEPTVMLSTGGKSVHCYWRLSQPIAADRWREITKRMIAYCKSDPSCKNPSRLMRLAGGTYIYKSDDKDAAGNSLGGTHGAIRAAIVSACGVSYDAETFELFLPVIEEPKPQEPIPYAIPPAPPVGGTVTPDQPRTYEELERMVAAYPPILKDNDQYHEAVSFIFGLCKAMEEIGRTRADAIALASRYHPGAADTFEQAHKAKIDKSQGGSFVKQCKAKGVDTRRHDIARKPVIDIDPSFQAMERPGADPVAALWSQPIDDDDAAATSEAVAGLLAAGREPITIRDVLPDGLALPLMQRAAAFPCDPMAFVLPVFCTAASVIGNRVKIRVKETWKEPFVLWGANIMPASSLKSPIAGVPLTALGKWQVALNKATKQAKASWAEDRNRVAMEADAAALKEWDKQNPPPPPGRELFIVDATLERVGQFLGQDSTPGMVAYHDELSLWFQQLKRGKDAMDQRSNWLSMWTGGLLKVDRVGRESIYVPNTAMSVFGLATVDGLANIRDGAKGRNENQDADGMWARFLLWQPDDVDFDYNDLDYDVTDLLCDLFRNRIDSKLPPTVEGAPLSLQVSEEAIELMRPHWREWYKESKITTAERGQWIGKLRGHSVRIAGILQILDSASKELGLLNPVTTETATRAIRLCYALLDQYDLLCPKIGGDTGDLDPAVAKLLANGIDWRKQHGKAPVTSEQLRRWKLPTREATAKERREWMQATIPQSGTMGELRMTTRSFEWFPPK